MSNERLAIANLTGGELNALVKKVGGEDAVRRILRGELIVGEPKNVTALKRTTSQKVLAGLLELVGEPLKLGAVKSFKVEKFRIDRNGELPISYIGDDLKTHVLKVLGSEIDAKPITLKQRKLLKMSVDGPILDALGGHDKARISLAHAFEFLKTADKTKWYLFYIEGTDWVLSAVWNVDGWNLEAYSVTSPLEWSGGAVVVSPR